MLAPIYNATKWGISGFVRSLAPVDKELGIRITAVAPGVIRTPLWTENAEKIRLIGKDDEWVTPESVAERMVELVAKDEIEVHSIGSGDTQEGTKMVKVEGGLILEVGKKVRKVEQFNDPGPSKEGNSVSGIESAHREIIGQLKKK